jgi:hypothetical protein
MVKKSDISEVMRALVKRRWAKATKQERSEQGRKAALGRWAKKKGEGHAKKS